MADQFDRASDVEALFLQAALQRQANKVSPDAFYTGYCLTCGDPVEKPRRWCCAKCRDDYEKELTQQRIRGER